MWHIYMINKYRGETRKLIITIAYFLLPASSPQFIAIFSFFFQKCLSPSHIYIYIYIALIKTKQKSLLYINKYFLEINYNPKLSSQ